MVTGEGTVGTRLESAKFSIIYSYGHYRAGHSDKIEIIYNADIIARGAKLQVEPHWAAIRLN